MPHSAATASNSRPALVVSGDANPLRASSATWLQAAALDQPAQALRAGSDRRRAPRRATRRPCATAGGSRPRRPASAPGSSRPARSQPREPADQQLATPDRAVLAVAGAVEDRPYGRAVLAVLGEARREVGMVVLHPDEAHVLELERVLGRQVLGMEVVRHHLRLDGEQALEVLDARR